MIKVSLVPRDQLPMPSRSPVPSTWKFWAVGGGLSIGLGVLVALRPVAGVAVAAAIASLALVAAHAQSFPRLALIGLTVCLGVLPAVPEYSDPLALITGAAALVALSGAFLRGVRPATRLPEILVLYLGVTLLWSEVTIAGAARAIVPFLFLLLHRCASPGFNGRWLAAVEVGGLILSGRIFLIAATGIGRTTWASLDFILPLHLVGALIAVDRLLRPGESRRARFAAGISGVLQLSAVVLTQTRGLVLAVGAGMAILVGSYGAARAVRLSGIGTIVGLTCLLYLETATEGAQLLAARFSAEGFAAGLGVRQLEARAAVEVWLGSPIFGAGLGTTFDNPVAGAQGAVSYVHNSLLYMLISGGVVAAGLFVGFWMKVVIAGRRRHNPVLVASGAAMFLFALTTAGFRSIHFNVLAAMLIGAASGRAFQTDSSDGSTPHAKYALADDQL